MVMRLVVDRYASRLDVMRYLLNITLDDTHILLDHAEKVQRQLRTLLAPYTVLAAVPSDTSVTCDTTNPWAAPVFRECVKSHTSSLSAHGTRLTPSEHLLLEAVQETTREICRVTTRMWASGLTAGIDPFYPADQRPEADRIRPLMDEWKKDMTELMSWLDWSVWVKCRPACGVEEMCYLPTWPIGFFPPPYDLPEPEGHPSPSQARENALLPDPNEGEWKRPQPKCIRRLAPYGF
ncbi:hypothetical protein M405DRAFT_830772 [Rhizopogon salebrosus TDB-379]|nr:hypothetical protein M405DRAFT_830772 [Rhizopogon salebrosus TDB-379]